MSRSLGQPSGQKKLTNIAAVRLKKQGIRFEIACYPNKVASWRSGCEKDLDKVLQSRIVYSNVSKAELAKSKDLKAAFGMTDQTKICLKILEKGQVQVAAKERELQLSNQFRDIANIVMQKTINPETQLPYTITMIERLLHKIHFSVHPRSSSKKQKSYQTRVKTSSNAYNVLNRFIQTTTSKTRPPMFKKSYQTRPPSPLIDQLKHEPL